MFYYLKTIFALIVIICEIRAFKICNLRPSEVSHIRTRNDNRYMIELAGHDEGYVPGRTYTIFLKINPFYPAFVNKFKDFMIRVEPSSRQYESSSEITDFGRFHLVDKAMTEFSGKCKDTVVQTNTVPKREVMVHWIAPSAGTGCVKIVAMVKVNRMLWFARDGMLEKELCELPEENENAQPEPLEKCCACDEAKYEIAFKGMWSRNTHPNNFPEDMFSTKFSELVGSSHKKGHTFWGQNKLASEGLKVLTETGDTKVLENELKENIDNIRTIIKARELVFPHLTGVTYSVFRVDRKKHLVSVVSKITPSPDWFVGVSNLELCLKNCSWVEQRVVNLYPYDAGTDDGTTYISPANPVDPQNPVRRLIDIIPEEDTESPFYREEGVNVKPFARLYLTRQKLYEKTCPDVDDEEEDPNCPTTDWSEWSECTDCFMMKTRSLINPDQSEECGHIVLETKKDCEDNDECKVGGEDEDVKGGGGGEDGEGAEGGEGGDVGEGGETTEGGEGGEGAEDGEGSEGGEGAEPAGDSDDQKGEPTEQTEDEETAAFNGISSDSNVLSTPIGDVIDCKVSRWSEWSECDEDGYKSRQRNIIQHPLNGGEACPSKLFKRRRCSDGGSREGKKSRGKHRHGKTRKGPRVDCVVSAWSAWSPCSANCGPDAVRTRTRTIIVEPNEWGKKCGPTIDESRCNLPYAC